MDNDENITNVAELFWSYCITVSLTICLMSTIEFMIIWFSAFLWTLTSPILNVIGTILGVIMTISFLIGIITIFIRSFREKFITNDITKK